MAGSLLRVHTVHTRVVRRRGRADTRASTEPHANRAQTEPDTTTPYRRDFEPRTETENAGRESVPYFELQVTTEVETVKQAEKTEIESQDKTLEQPRPKRDSDDEQTIDQPKSDLDALLRELKPVVLANGSGEVPAIDTQARTKTAHMTPIGVALAQPQIGAALVIGSWTRPDFCVTSPVTHVFAREDGVIVQTATKSRYFVEPNGETHLLRKSG